MADVDQSAPAAAERPLSMRPDHALVARVVASGVAQDAAEDMVARVGDAILAQLLDGKGARLPGIGRLAAPEKSAWVAGHRGKRAVLRRRVQLTSPVVIARGEPYDVA